MNNLARSLETLSKNITVLDTPDLPTPVCPDCNGTGYISYNVPFGDERFGKMYHCPNPTCPAVQAQKLKQAEEIMRHSSWASSYSDMTFDSFLNLVPLKDFAGKRGAFAAAYAFAYSSAPFTLNEASQFAWKQDWPNAGPHRSQSVVLTGDVGLGKTGLAVAATNAKRTAGQPIIFKRVRDLIRSIQETYRSNWSEIGNETSEQRIRRYTNVPFLVLDEFALENYSEDRLEIIETVIRERDRLNLPFMATTNLTQEDFRDGAHWGLRIADIIDKAHWVSIGGIKLRKTTTTAEGAW